MTEPYFDPEGSIKAINLKEKSGLFVGGLNLEGPPEGISDNESPDLFNIHFTRQNSIKPRDLPAQKFILSGVLAGFQIKNSYTFTDKNLVTWLVITDFVDVYITDNPSDMNVYAQIPIADGALGVGAAHPLNGAYTTRFTFLNGKLFGTNGIDPVWYYDIEAQEFQFLDTTNGHSEDVPKGRYICTHNSRIVLQNSTSSPSSIWQSQVQDETKFIHAITSVPLVFNPESGQGGMGIGVKSLQDVLVIYNTQSIDALLGWTDAEFTLQNWCKDSQKGCANANSIQEYTAPDGRTCHIYLAQNGTFYKLFGKDELLPIGGKLSKGLLNKVIQVYSYKEELIKVHGAGMNKFDDGNVNGTAISDSTAFFVPRGTNVNDEPDFLNGSLFTNQRSSEAVPNHNFNAGWTKWTVHNDWTNSDTSFNQNPTWIIQANKARCNTQHNATHSCRAAAISIRIIDDHTEEVLGTLYKVGDMIEFATSVMQRNNIYTVATDVPSSYDTFSNSIGASDMADFLSKIKYRKVRYQYLIHRTDVLLLPGGAYSFAYGGYTYIETDALYCDGSVIYANFTFDGTDSKSDNCNIDNAHGVMTFNMPSGSYFYSPQISIGEVSRWGAFDARYTDDQGAIITFEYRIYDGSNWGAWTAITVGASLYYSGIPTGSGIQIEFRILNESVTGYGGYYPNFFDFISVYIYKKIQDLPDIDSDICSLIFNEKYYCAMGVVDMGNFDGHNNILWEYDEWAGGPRWSRHDLWIDAMEVYAGKILFMNTDKGFVLDENVAYILEADNLLYANGMGSYYKVKSFDFDLAETLKWFKFLTFDFKKIDPTLPLWWHIENTIDDKYAGTILNYTLAEAVGLQYIIADGRTHKSRHGRCRKMEALYGSLNPQYYFYAYPTNPLDFENLTLGFGNRLQFMYLFYTGGEPMLKLNYEVLNTTIHIEPKDYAVLPVDKSNMKIVSNENA